MEDYEVSVIEREGAAPDCHIQHDQKRIVYVYGGDPLELVTLAQQAAERLLKGRQIPVLPPVD